MSLVRAQIGPNTKRTGSSARGLRADGLELTDSLKADEPLAFGGHGALDEAEVVEGNAGAHGDAFERVQATPATGRPRRS